MKVLIVASYNKGKFSPFITEQANSLINDNIKVRYFGIQGKGVFGYLSCRKKLLKIIKEYRPDLIHAHYGLSGLLANLQRKIPVITTFHGSDIHSRGHLLVLSKLCMKLSAYNIFVSKELYEIAKYKQKNFLIQPCGININTFYQIPKRKAREIIGWNDKNKYVLFAGSFNNFIKNYPMAKEAVSSLGNSHLIELKGYDRQGVNLLMNACDCLLLTSYREASPMVIKEAMACGCPVVSVDVGDVKNTIANTKRCYIAERNSEDIAAKLSQVLTIDKRNNGRERIIESGLELPIVAKNIIRIYDQVLNKQPLTF